MPGNLVLGFCTSSDHRGRTRTRKGLTQVSIRSSIIATLAIASLWGAAEAAGANPLARSSHIATAKSNVDMSLDNESGRWTIYIKLWNGKTCRDCGTMLLYHYGEQSFWQVQKPAYEKVVGGMMRWQQVDAHGNYVLPGVYIISFKYSGGKIPQFRHKTGTKLMLLMASVWLFNPRKPPLP